MTKTKTKIAYDRLIDAMHHTQYFKWHNNYFDGNLNYKSLALSIKKSTKSKKLHLLADEVLRNYEEEFVNILTLVKNID